MEFPILLAVGCSIGSAVGSYGAIWVHLRWIRSDLRRVEETVKEGFEDHSVRIRALELGT